MSELTLKFDREAIKSVNELMDFYRINNQAELIMKALRMLKLCSIIDKTDGQLIARKQGKETIILTR